MSRNITRHKKCRDGEDCKGPGCRVKSGKTAANVGRPHPNRTNAGAEMAPAKTGKKAAR